MKPDWKDIPEWVNWIWIGQSGKWFGGYKKPTWRTVYGYWDHPDNARWECISSFRLNEWNRGVCKASLERRP